MLSNNKPSCIQTRDEVSVDYMSLLKLRDDVGEIRYVAEERVYVMRYFIKRNIAA